MRCTTKIMSEILTRLFFSALFHRWLSHCRAADCSSCCTCETSARPSNGFFLSSFHLLFLSFALSVSSGNIPIYSSPAPPLHLLPPPLLTPFPSAKSGRPRRHHSPLGDNRHKRGLGGPGCVRSTCIAAGERMEESPPPLPVPSTSPSSPPPWMMKTLSVRIRKEQCASAQGITVIKAPPLHLCMSMPLSTYSLFVTLYQFWDSWGAFMLLSCCQSVVKVDFLCEVLMGSHLALLEHFDDQREAYWYSSKRVFSEFLTKYI